MPKPLTEFLSVSAPTLYFNVSHIPLSMSARKKRFSFSFQVGCGTLTSGISTPQFFDFRFLICDCVDAIASGSSNQKSKIANQKFLHPSAGAVVATADLPFG